MEFSTAEDYNLAVENHIKQLVETQNQAMSNDRNSHEKMKLAFDKKKVGKIPSHKLYSGGTCVDGCLTICQDKGQGWGQMDRSMSNNLGTYGAIV